MVLWTYSMMISDHARKTGFNTPTHANSAATSDDPVLVFLDDERTSNQAAVDAFIMMNTGTPCLRIPSHDVQSQAVERSTLMSETCNLKYPWQVMKAGVALLDGTHPDVDREIGPPLIQALCGLMEELGGLRSS
jgi:hypothetical protein